jgi:foldase protein PrsA
MVGNEKITLPEYKFYLSNFKNQMEVNNGVNVTDKNALKTFWETKVENETNAAKAKNQALDTLKELKVLLIKAKEEMIQLNNDDLTSIKSFMDETIQNEGGGDKAKAQESIASRYGISLEEYETLYKSSYLAYGKYGNGALKKIEVSDKDLKDFYDKNTANYDNVTVKHVLILTTDEKTGQDLPADKLEEKKKLADDILSKAKSGTDFESLVKQYSEDPGSKDSGGEYTFGKGKMVKEFEDWSFSAKEGDMGLVKTKYGYHIIKFIKKATFDSEKENVKKDLQTDWFKKQVEEWKKDEKYNLKINQKAMDLVKLY